MMNRRLVALGIALLIVVAGVRVADPTLDDEAATVELQDEPSHVVADSVRKMRTTTVTVDLRVVVDAGTPDETYRERAEIRADHDNQRYNALYGTGNDSERLGFFGTDGMGWTNSSYTEWGRAPSSRYPGFGTVMDPATMERSDARIVVDNETTLGVRFEDEDANDALEGLVGHTAKAHPGRLDVYIDKQRRLPVRAVRTYDIPARNTTVRVRYRFTRYGETDVERPEGVPDVSIWELLGDVYYS